jgi:hypothetical protein
MSLAAAVLVGSALASSPSGPAVCAGCTLDAAAEAQAMPLLVVLRAERARPDIVDTDQPWRGPALREGWAVLTLAGWERSEPSWIEDQVFAAARHHSIDLARVYLVGAGTSAAYIARHVQALSETFAAVAITGGGAALAACPEQDLPAYFRVEASDSLARTMRSNFERCKQPVTWSAPRGPLDRASASTILAWLHRHMRVTTVSRFDPPPGRVMRARCALSGSA